MTSLSSEKRRARSAPWEKLNRKTASPTANVQIMPSYMDERARLYSPAPTFCAEKVETAETSAVEANWPTTIRSTVPHSAWSRLAPNTGSIKSRINVWKHSGVSPVSLPCTSSDTHVSDRPRGQADAGRQWRQARVF